MVCHWTAADPVNPEFRASGHVLIEIMKYMKKMKKVFCVLGTQTPIAAALHGLTPARRPCE